MGKDSFITPGIFNDKGSAKAIYQEVDLAYEEALKHSLEQLFRSNRENITYAIENSIPDFVEQADHVISFIGDSQSLLQLEKHFLAMCKEDEAEGVTQKDAPWHRLLESCQKQRMLCEAPGICE